MVPGIRLRAIARSSMSRPTSASSRSSGRARCRRAIQPDEAHEGGMADIVARVSMPIVGCAVAPSLVEIGQAVDHIPAARESYRRMVEDLRNAQIDSEKGREVVRRAVGQFLWNLAATPNRQTGAGCPRLCSGSGACYSDWKLTIWRSNCASPLAVGDDGRSRGSRSPAVFISSYSICRIIRKKFRSSGLGWVAHSYRHFPTTDTRLCLVAWCSQLLTRTCFHIGEMPGERNSKCGLAVGSRPAVS
jgi:hypothetical protein